MKPIGLLVHEYHESKRDYQSCCNAIRERAVELGMDAEFAKDVTKAMAYLDGFKAGRSARDLPF